MTGATYLPFSLTGTEWLFSCFLYSTLSSSLNALNAARLTTVKKSEYMCCSIEFFSEPDLSTFQPEQSYVHLHLLIKTRLANKVDHRSFPSSQNSHGCFAITRHRPIHQLFIGTDMSGIENALTHAFTNCHTHFSYNDMPGSSEPLFTLSPAQRRQLEAQPALPPNDCHYWESRFLADCAEVQPHHFDLDPTVSAFQELLYTVPSRTTETDVGVTASDVRSGKYGALTRGGLKELEKLDKNQDYRLVTRTKEENDSMSGSMLWAPMNGGTPIVIESWNDDTTFPPDGAEVLQSIELYMLDDRYTDEGISAGELRSGKYGRLPPAINRSLEKLEKDKDYALTTFHNDHLGEDSYMAWVEKGTGETVMIGLTKEYR